MMSVIRATSPAIEWRGVGLVSGGESAAIAELRRLGPVAIGPDECRALLASGRVVVSWAVPDAVDLMPGGDDRPAHVAVSHSPGASAWARETLAGTRGVDRWVAVSEAARAPIPGAERGRAVVIPNAIDPARLRVTASRAATRAAWGLPPGAKVLGGLNRLSSEKRTERLIDAVAALPPEWYGVVVGEGIERSALERYAAEIAPGRVLFPGGRPDVGNVLAAFDRLLVASAYESFCLSLAEALWMGVPVLAAPVGIAAEHRECVRLLPADPTGGEVARAALEAPTDPGPGRALARTLWGPDALGRAWRGLLAPLLGPDDPLGPERRARGCVHRGCRTGCQNAICLRDHREAHFTNDCVPCARGA
jgi:hypothetical protein